ncbi:MAG: [Fe-Fe] hydrogenase large subunit C-terminal domain-containing protein, partial [Anaerovorax sp.]
QQYYPELLPYMAPVASPAVVHSQLLKKAYGKQIQVVFIGPCISKKYEVENNWSLDGAILFDELHDWLNEEESLKDEEVEEIHHVIHRLYPIPGGILQTISEKSKKGYSEIVIDGMESCIKILEELKQDILGEKQIKGQLIEMSACAGSCLYGPGLKDCNMPLLRAREKVCEAAMKETKTPMPLTERTEINCKATLSNLKIDEKYPDQSEIDEILKSMGKSDESHIYDCGACGYNTCKEKAVAVWQGKAEIKMCVPYMWSKMESFSNLVFDHSPNAIVLVDEKFSIVEYNNAAIAMFELYRFDHQGLPLMMLFDSSALEKEVGNGKPFYNEIQFVKDINKTIDITLVKGKTGADYILFVRDISEDMLQKEKMDAMRAETLETAQHVIDKQMRVAQEIASLLGETTGETKIALRNLKKSISDTK